MSIHDQAESLLSADFGNFFLDEDQYMGGI